MKTCGCQQKLRVTLNGNFAYMFMIKFMNKRFVINKYAFGTNMFVFTTLLNQLKNYLYVKIFSIKK